MARVEWGVRARRDLHSIVEFISDDSPKYAAMTASRIVQAARLLGQFPRRGRAVPEYHEDSIRELIIGSYRLVYRAEDDHVTILAVVHGSRDLARQLDSEPWNLP